MASNWAIVIGINEYRFLQPLKYAKRDAEAMQNFLMQEAKFDRIFLFTDDSPPIGSKPTEPFRANLLRVLRQIFATPFMKDGDNFWFFFSGHGIPHNGQDYLMPLDGDPEDIENTGISTNTITNYLRSCGADNAVMILDACRSSGKKSGEGIGRQTEAEARQTGVISFFSCSPDQYSYELEAITQGAFTYALLEGLGIRGRCATVERLNQYLENRVPNLVSQYLGGTRQIPYTIAEPLNRSHLILMPQHASLSDIATLKIDAYRAQMNQSWNLAQRLWIRVNAAASGQDMEAIEALQNLSIQRHTEPSSSQLGSRHISASSKSATESSEFSPSDTRRLDAAMPKTCKVGQRTEVRVMIALPNSAGLKNYLPDWTEAGDLISKKDAIESQFPFTFPVNSVTGKPEPTNIFISITASDFDVEQATRNLYLSPNQDSGVVTFLITPRIPHQRGRVIIEVFEDSQKKVHLGSLTLITEVVEQQRALTKVIWQLVSLSPRRLSQPFPNQLEPGVESPFPNQLEPGVESPSFEQYDRNASAPNPPRSYLRRVNYAKWGVIVTAAIGIPGAIATLIQSPELSCQVGMTISECVIPQKTVEFVVQAETGEPLSNVQIVAIAAKGAPETQHTDAKGYVKVNIPSKGNVRITLIKKGYPTQDFTINLANDSDTIKIIRLSSSSNLEKDGDVTWELKQCTREKNNVSCSFLLTTTNERVPYAFWLGNRSKMTDYHGYEYFSSKGTFVGNKAIAGSVISHEIQTGAEYAVSIDFAEIPTSVVEVNSLIVENAAGNPIRFDNIHFK